MFGLCPIEVRRLVIHWVSIEEAVAICGAVGGVGVTLYVGFNGKALWTSFLATEGLVEVEDVFVLDLIVLGKNSWLLVHLLLGPDMADVSQYPPAPPQFPWFWDEYCWYCGEYWCWP